MLPAEETWKYSALSSQPLSLFRGYPFCGPIHGDSDMNCHSSLRSLTRLALIILTNALPLCAQTHPARLVIAPVDDAKRMTLHGTVHPLAQARYDRGEVDDSLPAARVLLLLNRPADREAELQKFLVDVHRRGSGSYHQWLTPQQFGARFGPADSDIQAAEGWLRSRGFSVSRVTKSKQFIEFSGTVGQLRNAFHTQIHQYDVNGEAHYANATDLSIPAALGSLVRGVSPLNNFRAQPLIRNAGPALYSRATKRATPEWTITNPFGTPNPYAYPVAPEDLATQYDLNPLYQAGVNGTGQTIGIINESNIDLSLVAAYQQLFGLANNPTQVVIDGDDPGTLNGVDTEAYLDVEVSGAIAPNATVNLYIADGGDLVDPLELAAIRAIEDNQASVLSVSFGSCEAGLGNAGNQFWSGLWEEAAAQGQTVFVSSGDSGPYCNYGFYMQVSGIASTPWNIAVGGTDFYYSDYATGGASATTLWNQTNDSQQGSLIAPLPEQAWNDPFGLDVISDGIQRGEIFAGGGGASSCSTQNSNSICASGYAKPSWQMGTGVPDDGVRDIPDISLFASNGANLSAYPICAFPGECAAGVNDVEVSLTGGTSASSPAMAGIMALVNQKYGRQGQANFTLYPLAQQQPSAFHDITLGGNQSLCSSGMTDCVLNANGYYGTTIYPSGAGYDLATGLGSVDANALVNDWNSITFLPTTTKLTLSSTKITHGTPVTVTTSVAPTSGTGTPTGGVAIATTSPSPASQGQTVLTLNGGTASSSVDFFPGGYYNVSASYSGDATFGSSSSSPVALTVSAEKSNINFAVLNRGSPISNNGSVPYNSPLSLTIQPTGVSAPSGQANGNATGTATFTADSTTATVPLSGVGVASWTPPALAPGSHTVNATYSGDASFNASSATAITFSVAKGVPLVNDYIDAPKPPSGPSGVYINVGGSLPLTIEVGPINGPLTGVSAPIGTATPTGTVTVCLSTNNNCTNAQYSQTATLSPLSGTYAQYATASVTFTNLAAGYYVGSIYYNGDANWQAEQLIDTALYNINVGTLPTLTPSATTLSITPTTISGSQVAQFTTTITGSSGIFPTGYVDYYDNGLFLTYVILPQNHPGSSFSFSFVLNASSFLNSGSNQIMAIYDGDSNYTPSESSVVDISSTQGGGDFALGPQQPQITVKSGGSGTVGLNLTSVNNFDAVVNLTCAPSSSQITCSVSPSAPTVNGAATATLTVMRQRSLLPCRCRVATRGG
jgi:subtilase family serine protease